MSMKKWVKMVHTCKNNVHKAQIYSDLQPVPLTNKIK